MKRTRIKICGLTRVEDVAATCAAGADAVGFVCYPRSSRFVAVAALPVLAAALSPFVTPVLLFVNAAPADIERALACVPNALLQFHGDESAADCARFRRPYLRAVRVADGVDLLDCERVFASAAALLADAPAPGYGGGGAVFDWDRLPPRDARGKPLILAGGLDERNVADAIRRVHPDAVDVSSGVEQAPGIKSAQRIQKFIAAVRIADKAADNEPA
jgi:phosphoribosylanthranilate isomerase